MADGRTADLGYRSVGGGGGDVVNLHYINYKYITLGLSPVVDGQ